MKMFSNEELWKTTQGTKEGYPLRRQPQQGSKGLSLSIMMYSPQNWNNQPRRRVSLVKRLNLNFNQSFKLKLKFILSLVETQSSLEVYSKVHRPKSTTKNLIVAKTSSKFRGQESCLVLFILIPSIWMVRYG